ncbi:MAG: hypothetical protein AAF704_12975, partial [Cyanobacteria bacterium P01_D01_bin.123]
IDWIAQSEDDPSQFALPFSAYAGPRAGVRLWLFEELSIRGSAGMYWRLDGMIERRADATLVYGEEGYYDESVLIGFFYREYGDQATTLGLSLGNG